MLSQTVLLRGVNDDPEVLGALMRAFVETRIKPYYLHHGDLAPGTRHFRVSLEEGRALVAALRGRSRASASPPMCSTSRAASARSPVGPACRRRIAARTGPSDRGSVEGGSASLPAGHPRHRDRWKTAGIGRRNRRRLQAAASLRYNLGAGPEHGGRPCPVLFTGLEIPSASGRGTGHACAAACPAHAGSTSRTTTSRCASSATSTTPTADAVDSRS